MPRRWNWTISWKKLLFISQVVIYDLKVNMELMRFPLLSLVKTSLWWQFCVRTSVWHIETSVNHIRSFMCARLAFMIDGYSGVAYELLGTPNENVFSNALRGLCNNTVYEQGEHINELRGTCRGVHNVTVILQRKQCCQEFRFGM